MTMKSELSREGCDNLKEIMRSENVIGVDWSFSVDGIVVGEVRHLHGCTRKVRGDSHTVG